MLNNFIYAKTKDLFLKELEAGNVLDKAIVFIEDTKEIWNHGTYFDGKSVDVSNIEESVNNILNNKSVIQAIDTSEELDDVETNTYVKYVAQTLTDAQKQQVRKNIGVRENIDLSGYATKDDLNNKQDVISDLEAIKQGAAKGATALQSVPEGYAKSSDLQTKADDSSVVHKTGNESITGAKTFNSGVNFLGSGDSNAITLSLNTRININNTNKTVLGFGSSNFYINHGDYTLLLRGKATRPTYNNVDLALFSDVSNKQDTISDLDTIRNGASAGATALQSVPSEYVTETELAEAIASAITNTLNTAV